LQDSEQKKDSPSIISFFDADALGKDGGDRGDGGGVRGDGGGVLYCEGMLKMIYCTV
jgi:hypothetical protein